MMVMPHLCVHWYNPVTSSSHTQLKSQPSCHCCFWRYKLPLYRHPTAKRCRKDLLGRNLSHLTISLSLYIYMLSISLAMGYMTELLFTDKLDVRVTHGFCLLAWVAVWAKRQRWQRERHFVRFFRRTLRWLSQMLHQHNIYICQWKMEQSEGL